MREIHTGLRFSALMPFTLMLITVAALTGCMGTNKYNNTPWVPKSSEQTPHAKETPSELSKDTASELNAEQLNHQAPQFPPVKVAILLPLSGQHAKLGNAMLNAAQLALFDLGFNSYELLPQDTKGTPAGAETAANQAIQNGAQLVLGPVFSHSVKAARPILQSSGIKMVAFSTDWTLANNNTFLIGFLPFDQIERVTSYAVSQGYNRIGVLAPQDNYGNAVTSAFNNISHYTGINATKVARFSPRGNDLGPVVKNFSDYETRKNASSDIGAPFDAVLMPVGGTLARQVGSFLNHYDLPPYEVRRLGTGLMDDTVLASDKTLDGTWFAAPDPVLRKKFENKYKSTFYEKPPRIASLAYDATALSIILARMSLQHSTQSDYSHSAITNPNGFAGVDGIFRFRNDGISERGLAILEYNRGRIKVLDQAPTSFQKQSY